MQITAGDLVDYLSKFDPNQPVVLHQEDATTTDDVVLDFVFTRF